MPGTLPLGCYVRANVLAAPFGDRTSLKVVGLHRVHDCNEVTTHLLSCIFQRLHLQSTLRRATPEQWEQQEREREELQGARAEEERWHTAREVGLRFL